MMSLRHLWQWNPKEEAWKCDGRGANRTAFMWGRSAADDFCKGCNATLTLAQYHDMSPPIITEEERFRRLDRIEELVKRILGNG